MVIRFRRKKLRTKSKTWKILYMVVFYAENDMNEFFDADDPASIRRFNAMLTAFYQKNRRPMPWRDEITAYRVLVSEIMLQQTQVSRVLKKFDMFIQVFPDLKTLAQASLEDVLRVWQGLGYNRRAQYLLQIARAIMDRWSGLVPDDPALLQTLPGLARLLLDRLWYLPIIARWCLSRQCAPGMYSPFFSGSNGGIR
jgi:3-methyladenine DNA glycosylase/8-oxoguanine DNA glycosylase